MFVTFQFFQFCYQLKYNNNFFFDNFFSTSKREDEDTIEKQFAPRIVKPPPFTKKPIKAWMG